MEKEYVTKTTETQEKFVTGSRRGARTGKGRFDLIPTMPLRRLAGLYERGAIAYSDRNWERGQNVMRYIDSAMRHLNNVVAGERVEDNEAAVCWNMFAFMWTLAEIEAGRLPRSLDDRPPPEPQFADPSEGPSNPSKASNAQLALPFEPSEGPSQDRQLSFAFPDVEGPSEPAEPSPPSADAERLAALPILCEAFAESLDHCGNCRLRRDLHGPTCAGSPLAFRGYLFEVERSAEGLRAGGLLVGERWGSEGAEPSEGSS